VVVAAAEVAEAGAGADATATEPRDTSGPGPLVELRAYAVPIVPVRLVLGLGGLAGARVLGVSAGAGLWLFALGAGMFLVAAFAGRRGLFWQRAAAAEPVDPTARIESRARTLVHAAYPSTIAVSALTAIALPIDASLAAVMAGILGGMAVGGLIFAVQLVLWEDSGRVRLLATTKGFRAKLFVRSAG
jgi:hypothetical protein